METNCNSHMQTRLQPRAGNSISSLGDIDGIRSFGNEVKQKPGPGPESESEAELEPEDESVAANNSRHSLNPRIQFLRLSAIARGQVGVLGSTPPYQPVPPSLYRPLDEDEHSAPSCCSGDRLKSPLRNLLYVNQPLVREVRTRQTPSNPNTYHTLSTSHRSKPTRMPQTGFQALILCGPGIGLSTFTSTPTEFPKALVEVANRPMVWYVLDWCYRMGVTDITLITPPTSKEPIAAALAQNPYLTSLPSPSPDLLAPKELEYTTPTAELLSLSEVQAVIKSDFVVLPCDLVCSIPGEHFLETYLTRLGGSGGISSKNTDHQSTRNDLSLLGPETRNRRGGLSIWYNTIDREDSVKGEECDFMCTTQLDSQYDIPLSKTMAFPHQGILRKLVWTMPMSELWDQCEENKSWKIRQSLLRKHGAIKCMTKYRDSHIYFFPYWVKEFANSNEDFESISEDLVGTWAKAEWRKPSYRTRIGAKKIFGPKSVAGREDIPIHDRPVEEEIDLLSLSSTQITVQPPSKTARVQRPTRLASRVQAAPDISIITPDDTTDNDPTSVPSIPPILSYILPSSPDAPLVRRLDTTPLVLSVSLALAKLPSLDECTATKTSPSPFSHQYKVQPTATVAPRVTITRSDTLIDSNSTIATQCVIKSSVIGSSVAIGTGTRITGCVIMDGATVGDKCVLTNTVIGKKAKIGSKSILQNCEVQDGNVVAYSTEGKGEKYLVGGLEDEIDDEEGDAFDDHDEDDGEGLSIGDS